MKKASEVFKSIRFAKAEPRGKPHSSTDEEGHYTVGEKEFNQQLKHVKKMAMQEEKKDVYDEGEYDREGDMAKSDLRSIIANAKKLHDMIGDADNLPEWVQSKITVAEDYISTVANYMTAEVNEEVQYIEEKNAPTNPELWSRAKALAKSKFDVYPSAYANGWAAKWYKSKGGGWRTVSEESLAEAQSAKTGIYQTDVLGAKAYHAKCMDPNCKWESKRYDRIKQAQAAAEKHAKDHFKQEMKEEVEHLDEKVVSTQLQSVVGNHVVNSATHTHPDAEHAFSDTLVHKGTISSKGGSNKKKFEVHNHPNHGLVFKTDHTDDEKQSIKKHLIQNKMAGRGTAIHEEVEQLEEMPGANMDTRAVHAHLKKKGWKLSRTSGSHDVYTHPDAEHHISVPRHKQLKAPLVKGILKQSTVNEEIDDQIIEDAIAFLKEGRPSQQHPLEGHDYHKKTDAELRYIAKDAHEAAEAMKSHNTQAENKYRDQANDSATVRYWRQKHGMPDWYKKKYGHIKEAKEDVPFDGPYKKAGDAVTDKSGAKHTAMSRVKHLAKQAMKKQTERMKKPRLEEEKNEEMSTKTKIVRDLAKKGKKNVDDKEMTAGGKDKYEANPELTSQIVKT